MFYFYIQENDSRLGTMSSRYSKYYAVNSNYKPFYSELQNYQFWENLK